MEERGAWRGRGCGALCSPVTDYDAGGLEVAACVHLGLPITSLSRTVFTSPECLTAARSPVFPTTASPSPAQSCCWMGSIGPRQEGATRTHTPMSGTASRADTGIKILYY